MEIGEEFGKNEIPKDQAVVEDKSWEAPIDEEGYVQSFLADEEKELLDFFHKYGFVVVRNIISADQCEKTEDDLWRSDEMLGSRKVDRNEPSTWENGTWPSEMNLAEGGFLTHLTDMSLQTGWDNRQHPNLYKIFSLVFNNPNLWVRFDRYGMMRPTKGIKMKNGNIVDKPEWKTKSNWLHWDQNPWQEPDFVRVQGLLALTNAIKTSGGFHCVPGFAPNFKKWSIDNVDKRSKGSLINVPANDVIRTQIQPITLRKGSLLIWDSRTPHGNFPNDDSHFRVVQYITFFPAQESDKKLVEDRLDAFYMRTNDDPSKDWQPPKLTELGEKILGWRKWKENQKVDWHF